MTLRVVSLCTGYAGLDGAVMSVLGGELAYVADNAPGPSKILAHRFPRVPNLGDISAADWSQVAPADIVCAGFPCTDVSAAGARAGLLHGTRSGVWHHVATAVGALRPRLVVIENVRGLLTSRGDEPIAEHLAAEASRDAYARLLIWLDTERNIAYAKGNRGRVRQCSARIARVMGLRKRAVARCQWHERRLVRAIGTVLGSLAACGYDAQWALVSAAEAGAPHKRERVFIIAWPAADAEHDGLTRAALTGAGEGPQPGQRRQWRLAQESAGDGRQRTAENPDRATGGERRQPAPRQEASGRSWADTCGPSGAPDFQSLAAGVGSNCADPGGEGLEIWSVERHGPECPTAERGRGDALADTERDGLRRGTGSAGEAHAQRPGSRPAAEGCSSGRLAADPGRARLGEHPGEPPAQEAGPFPGDQFAGDSGLRADTNWGPYRAAIERWQRVLGRDAPRPTEPGRTGERLSPRFVEWMQGLPPGWVTDVPGLSRNEQLEALGNGVVPQQAVLALSLLLPAWLEAIKAGEAA